MTIAIPEGPGVWLTKAEHEALTAEIERLRRLMETQAKEVAAEMEAATQHVATLRAQNAELREALIYAEKGLALANRQALEQNGPDDSIFQGPLDAARALLTKTSPLQSDEGLPSAEDVRGILNPAADDAP